jgi:hypothetical protein
VHNRHRKMQPRYSRGCIDVIVSQQQDFQCSNKVSRIKVALSNWLSVKSVNLLDMPACNMTRTCFHLKVLEIDWSIHSVRAAVERTSKRVGDSLVIPMHLIWPISWPQTSSSYLQMPNSTCCCYSMNSTNRWKTETNEKDETPCRTFEERSCWWPDAKDCSMSVLVVCNVWIDCFATCKWLREVK